MYKHLYQRFIAAAPERQHFAAHSHHLWPDVTRDAQLLYWDDSAKLADKKWGHILGTVVPAVQRGIAAMIGLSHPEQICFAPNTHEFILRILSCFNGQKPVSILTTDGEFHSLRRQLDRLQEESSVAVHVVPVEPFESFEERFIHAANKQQFDLVFTSHVFFTFGYAIQNLTHFVERIGTQHGAIVIDGYHSFCALPFDLRSIEDRVFYLSGGYKYAQAGEGACFMSIPKGCVLRPVNTGWFASFETLERKRQPKELVHYADDAYRFWGSTFDPSGLYRLRAVLQLLQQEGLTVERIHQYVVARQEYFKQAIAAQSALPFPVESLLQYNPHYHGHFLTYRFSEAQQVCQALAAQHIITDVRGDCLRFGFGLYHTDEDTDRFLETLRQG
jgi:selenocysteine lyase/cysteine desulfurase